MWRKLTDKERLHLIHAYTAVCKKESAIVVFILWLLTMLMSITCYDALKYTSFTATHIFIVITELIVIALLLCFEILYVMHEVNSIRKNKARICSAAIMDKRLNKGAYEVLLEVMEYNVTHRCWVKTNEYVYNHVSRYTQASVIQFAEGRYIDMFAFDKDLDYIYIS